ncbi:hypothetical protein AQUCO_01000316v1 [Aquilegia coerulea]|uniref:AB hydrolase-1 domain-containing protein n=1 Tax=Aquilegia coerulea TaxID=218851 RepID=A0A2G5E9D9_AQUCA|nr:hypothetical protein AQUCO_01000316v1 [Aquilegia coerulea]
MLIACADSLILSWSIFKTGHHTLRREDLRIIERMMSSKNKQYHFVLVHGLGHGAWCWYKVRTLLESVGHQVTALDLAASGVNLKTLDEVHTMLDYSQPLLEFMETIPMNERVIIVGNSLGGFSLAYAMDKFPEKISVAVFVAAFMPDTSHGPSYVMDKLSELAPKENFMDTKFAIQEGAGKPKTTMHFGPEFIASKLYPKSSPEVSFTTFQELSNYQ